MRKRILVVDDYAPFAMSLRLLLSRDFDVDLASTAAAALESLAATPYDVILCDLCMPEMDGRELFLHLSARNREAAERMLFMSGGACSAELEAFVAGRSERLLPKPLKESELFQRVAELASRKE